MAFSLSRLRAALVLVAVSGCQTSDTPVDTPTVDPVSLRVATFNVAMFRTTAGALVADLAGGDDAKAEGFAAIVQTVRPDVLLVNEVDWDVSGEAARLLAEQYLNVGQGDREPIDYPYRYVPTVNTGVSSGFDLDNNGRVVTTPGSQDYANDAFGFGLYEGQYGMVLLSRYPIDVEAVRTFQRLKWSDMPDALLPSDFYAADALAAMRLSSKTHADVPIEVGGHRLHALIAHPTPPNFDGDEDRNGKRNHDEIRLWTDYIGGASWIVDDDGVAGGAADAPFIILGDLNSDPFDGDSRHEAIVNLIDHPRIKKEPVPSSEGAAEQAGLQGGRNRDHSGPAAHDTADFNESVGNLRVDYALPSASMNVHGAGVFWPLASDPDFALVGTSPFPVTDHRLVWVDVTVGDQD